MRIEFEPTLPVSHSFQEELEVGGGAVRREREDSWISVTSTSNRSSFSSSIGMRRRSSSSNTALSSPASPPKMGLAKGAGERYGSIDAAFSNSTSPPRRTSSEGFGAIGGGGRRCSTGSGSIIGQGWSGFNSTPSQPHTIPENGGGSGIQFDPFATSTPSTPVPLSPTSKSTSIEDSLGLQMNLGGASEGVWNDQPPSLGYGWASNSSSGSNAGGGKKQGSPRSEKSASPTATRRNSGALTGGGAKNANGGGKVKEDVKEGGERRKRDQRGGGGRRKESGGKA